MPHPLARRRGLGSVAILGTSRTAFLFGSDPLDRSKRVFACTKSKLAALPPSLRFRIAPTPADAPLVEWLGPVNWTADDLIRLGRPCGEAVPAAMEFLQGRLAHGACRRQELVLQAAKAGISFRTLERAKAQLGVLSKQGREVGRKV
jgi:hypothetical protein